MSNTISYVPQNRIEDLAETLDTKVSDSVVVHKSGNETITGIKTIAPGTPDIRIINKFTDYELGEVPSTTHYAGYMTVDNSNNQLGNCNTSISTAGTIGNNFYVVNKKQDGTNISATLGVYAEISGNTYAVCPAPSASSSTSTTYIATTGWVNNPSLSTNVVHRTGDETIAGTKTFSSTIQGTSLNALWADLAENYKSDTNYKAGTLIEFSGDKEITIAKKKVNGVISTKPAILMNRSDRGLPVALLGRVPVKVIGKCSKFDKLCLSETNGIARKKKWYEFFKRTIAISLESKDNEEIKSILCVTKFNLD